MLFLDKSQVAEAELGKEKRSEGVLGRSTLLSSLQVQHRQEGGKEGRLQRASEPSILNQCPVSKAPRAGPAAGLVPISSWEMKSTAPAAG